MLVETLVKVLIKIFSCMLIKTLVEVLKKIYNM
jgi:hypothetical protein